MGLAAISEAVAKACSFDAPFDVGDEKLAVEGTPRRVVWVPKTDTFTAPAYRGTPQRRSLFTRRITSHVHLWGKDLADAEAMLEAFIVALWQTCGPNFELLGGAWLGQSVMSLGRVYVLGVAIQAPIAEPAQQWVTITGETTDVALQH